MFFEANINNCRKIYLQEREIEGIAKFIYISFVTEIVNI